MLTAAEGTDLQKRPTTLSKCALMGARPKGFNMYVFRKEYDVIKLFVFIKTI